MTVADTNQHFSAVWVWDDSASSYTDHTVEATIPSGTAFTVPFDTDDYLYFGSASRFDQLFVDINTPASGLGTLTWQFWNGAAWTQLIPRWSSLPQNEDQQPFLFTRSGGEILPVSTMKYWTPAILSDIDNELASPPDSEERYWIRVKASSVTSAPTIKGIQKRAYNAYCTPQEVFDFLQLQFEGGSFSQSTFPNIQGVEDIIYRRQGTVDTYTRKSWRPNLTIEYLQFNLGGLVLTRKDVRRVLSLEIWNGQSWEIKLQGRDAEYYFVPEIDIINFSRLFLLPARFIGTTRGYYGFGIGEFDHPVRVTYLHGRDLDLDAEEGGLIRDAIIKLVAADIMSNAEWAKIIVSGVDHIPVETRAAIWRDEAMESIDQVAHRFEAF